jgi:hypothetical protein
LDGNCISTKLVMPASKILCLLEADKNRNESSLPASSLIYPIRYGKSKLLKKNINCPCALRRLVEVHRGRRGSRTSKIGFSDKYGGPKKRKKRKQRRSSPSRLRLACPGLGSRLQFICSSFPEAPSVAGEAASSSSSNAADAATSPIVAGGQPEPDDDAAALSPPPKRPRRPRGGCTST